MRAAHFIRKIYVGYSFVFGNRKNFEKIVDKYAIMCYNNIVKNRFIIRAPFRFVSRKLVLGV